MDNEERKKQELKGVFVMGAFFEVGGVYFALHMGNGKYATEETNIIDDATNAASHIAEKPLAVAPFTTKSGIYAGAVSTIIVLVTMSAYVKTKRRQYDLGASGTAKWNTNLKRYNKKYTSPFGKVENTGYDNIILTNEVFMSLNGRKTRRNTHTLVTGGSGTGKSRNLIKPNILQFNASFAITDPQGELLESTGKALEAAGYEIKVFNISEMHKSMTYNPYAYIRDENGVRTMVKCIIDNTQDQEAGAGEQIWKDGTTALLQAISFYMIEELKEKDRTFFTVMKLLRLAKIDENDVGQMSAFDKLFEKLREKNPESMAVMSYDTFRVASGKTLKSFLANTMTRLDVFNMTSVRNLTSTDTIHLEELGTKKCALFLIIPAADKTYNFLAATLYSQLFETLYHQGENVMPHSYYFKKKLPNGAEDVFLVPTMYVQDKKTAEDRYNRALNGEIKYNEKTNRYEIIDSAGDMVESYTKEEHAKNFLEGLKEAKITKGKRMMPYDVRFLLDEWANVGKIPAFVEMLTTMRKYRLSCTIIVQTLSQIKTMYEKEYETIISNCDEFLFLGSQGKESLEYIRDMLSEGEVTQKSDTISEKNSSEGRQINSQALMTFDRLRELPDDDCVLLIRGERPFYQKKYIYENHKNYKMTGDFDPENNYVIEFDNRANKDVEQDQVKLSKMKIKQIKQEKKLFSFDFDMVTLYQKVCEGDVKKLDKISTVEAETEKVAKTKEEKEVVKKKKKKYASGVSEKIDGQDIVESNEDFADLVDTERRSIWEAVEL